MPILDCYSSYDSGFEEVKVVALAIPFLLHHRDHPPGKDQICQREREREDESSFSTFSCIKYTPLALTPFLNMYKNRHGVDT